MPGADRTALKEVDGAGEAVVHTLKLAVKALEHQVMERPVIASWQALLDCSRLRLARSRDDLATEVALATLCGNLWIQAGVITDTAVLAEAASARSHFGGVSV